MNDSLISLFIDNELELPEKLTFVRSTRDDTHFADEAIALIKQEQLLRMHRCSISVNLPADAAELSLRSRLIRLFYRWWQPAAGFAAALVVITLFLPYFLRFQPQQPIPLEHHRFVLYLPETSNAAILGTFTDWQPVTMNPTGTSGYWSVTLPVTAGEHRYSYLIGDEKRVPDPSIADRELDDFGGENSVIVVGGTYEPLS